MIIPTNSCLHRIGKRVMLTFSNAYKTLSSPVLSWLSSLRGVNPLSNFQGMIFSSSSGFFMYKRTFVVLIPLTSVRNWGSISDFWHIVNQGNKAYISAKQLLSFSDFGMSLQIAPLLVKNYSIKRTFWSIFQSYIYFDSFVNVTFPRLGYCGREPHEKCQKS